MKVVIVGGGIIGCATAYYLNELGADCVIIEQGSIACSSSGKAGGFLARDWAAGPLGELCRLSFQLHQDLADKFGAAAIQYRRLHAHAAKYHKRMSARRHRRSSQIGAINPNKSRTDRLSSSSIQSNIYDVFNGVFDKAKIEPGLRMGSPEVSAQVTPWLLTREMFLHSNSELIIGEVTEVNFSRSDVGKIESLLVKKTINKTVQGQKPPKNKNHAKSNPNEHNSGFGSEGENVFELVTGDEFCFCMGPWSDLLYRLGLKVPRSYGLKVHSVLVRPIRSVREKLQPVAAFTDYNNTEIYPRPDGNVYLNGSEAGTEIVDYHPSKLQVMDGACEKIIAFFNDITTKSPSKFSRFTEVAYNQESLRKAFENMEKMDPINNISSEENIDNADETVVLRKQICHLPLIEHKFRGDKLPVMCCIPETLNGYICTGHSCWGILCAPGSGKIMAELIYNNDANLIMDTTAFQL